MYLLLVNLFFIVSYYNYLSVSHYCYVFFCLCALLNIMFDKMQFLYISVLTKGENNMDKCQGNIYQINYAGQESVPAV